MSTDQITADPTNTDQDWDEWIGDHRESLEELADGDYNCSWVAQELLDSVEDDS